MQRLKAFILGLLIAVTVGAMAQDSVIPSKLRIKQLTVTNIYSPAFSQPIKVESNTPALLLRETDGTAGNQRWVDFVSNEQRKFSIASDDEATITNWMTVDRTGTTVDTVNIQATTLTKSGVTIATQENGSFTAAFADACTTTLNVTVNWSRAGNLVTMRFPTSASCTSDSAEFISGIDVPSAIRPTNSIEGPVYGGFINNGANQGGCVWINSAGNMEFQRFDGSRCLPGTWTTSGTKGFSMSGQMVFTYPIN